MKLITLKVEEQKDGTWKIERGIPSERKTFKEKTALDMFYKSVECLIRIMHSPAKH